MKYLIVALMILGSSFAFSETNQLPDAVINQEVLGGDILLIKMKDYLVVTGKESQALEQELGAETKSKLTQDIIMTKSADELAALYNPTNDKPTVQKILIRYADVLARVDAKPSLN
jgi:hypothetical protein